MGKEPSGRTPEPEDSNDEAIFEAVLSLAPECRFYYVARDLALTFHTATIASVPFVGGTLAAIGLSKPANMHLP